ncbi:unnamed protein product, partial [Staurois parvus]
IVNAGPGRADIVNAGSGESGYSEPLTHRGSGDSGYSERGGPGTADIVNAGSGDSGYSERWSGESGYSECRVWGSALPGPAFTMDPVVE